MARSIDRRGRLFGKVSMVDILVFLAIVAVVGLTTSAVLHGSGRDGAEGPIPGDSRDGLGADPQEEVRGGAKTR